MCACNWHRVDKRAEKSKFVFGVGFGTVRKMFNKVRADIKHLSQMIKQIGGHLLDKVADAKKATHVIAGDKGTTLRRTPKLMIGLCTTTNIVNLDWLTRSAKERKPLPASDFLLVDDEEAEKKMNFDMRETLMRAGRMRSDGRTLLDTYFIYLCAGVAGNKAKNNRTPPMDEFRLIIEAAGAKWIKNLPSTKKNKLKAWKIIIILSKDKSESAKQMRVKSVAEAIKNGAICKTTEDLFHWIMTQKFEVNE